MVVGAMAGLEGLDLGPADMASSMVAAAAFGPSGGVGRSTVACTWASRRPRAAGKRSRHRDPSNGRRTRGGTVGIHDRRH